MKIQKYIIITGLLLFLLGAGEVFAQQRQVITGKVLESFGSGQTDVLIGCNINILNKDNRSIGGTVTNIDGAYVLQIPVGENDLTIEFSYIGMKTYKVKYTGQRTLNVTLEANVQTITEVAVTGRRIVRNDMGVGAKENVTATQKIEMDEIVSTVPVLSIEEALQGRLGGVDITIGGGDPGARSSIRIRGTSTLSASSEPLIVIDGVPYSTDIDENFDFSTANNEDLGALINIAPTDIETVEVLKDAAATAIWGTKGSSGVLLITTKRGTPGKTSFNFSSKFTAKQEPRTIPMLNGNQYVALMQEAIWNAANYEGFQGTTDYLAGLYNTRSIAYDPDWRYFNEYNQNTDWLDEIRQTAFSWDNNFSMSGGGDRATYRFSLGLLDENGTTIGTGLQRFSTSMRVDYKFSNKLNFGADFAYSQSDVNSDYAGSSSLRSEAFRKMPNKSPYYIDPATGERTSTYFSLNEEIMSSGTTSSRLGGIDDKYNGKDNKNYNPVAMAHNSYSNSIARDTRITFRLDYNIVPGLTYRGLASINMKATKNRKFLPQEATGVVLTDEYSNRSTDGYSGGININFDNTLIYNKTLAEIHKITATAKLLTSMSEKNEYSSQTAGNVSSSLSDPIIGNRVVGMASGTSESRSVSGTGLFNYTLLDRYTIQGSATIEGNSAVGKGRRTAFFPTVGITYNMQEEPFLRDFEWLDESKLRFAVGQSGKAPSGSSVYLGAFQAYNTYMDMAAIHPIRMQLNDLRWETSTEYNVGAELSFLQGKLRFTIDAYNKYTRDLLQKEVDIPSTTGYSNVLWYNSGEMTNKGWEFRTDVELFRNKDWRVTANINFSRNINEVVKIPENMTDSAFKFANGEYQTIVTEGRPVGSFYGLRYQGVYTNKDATYARDAEGNVMNDINGNPIITQINGDKGVITTMPGDAQYEDINHDGVIDKYDIVYLGSSIPVVTGGGGFSVSYKQLSLNAFFHGRFGQKVINQVRMQNEAMYTGNNQSTAVLRRWRSEGDETDIPRALYDMGYNYIGSDRFVENASYLRLKSVSLTYRIPQKTLKLLGLNSANIFVTGYDLFTFTKYTGQDPEIAPPSKANKLAKDGANTPVSMRLSCGVNIGF
jgi:TonB-linked outer membrane protein, SusC/RagA family